MTQSQEDQFKVTSNRIQTKCSCRCHAVGFTEECFRGPCIICGGTSWKLTDEQVATNELVFQVNRYLQIIDQWCGPDPDPNMPIVAGARDLQAALDTYKALDAN